MPLDEGDSVTFWEKRIDTFRHNSVQRYEHSYKTMGNYVWANDKTKDCLQCCI